MQVLLLSDTHSHYDAAIARYAQDVDEIWHAGDIGNVAVYEQLANIKPLRAVYGNIDGHELRLMTPENLVFTVENLKIYITHIAGYPGKYAARVRQIIASERPGLVICGHSHILKIMPDKYYNHIHFNPGAMGLEGFHKIKTMLRFCISQGKISNLEIIEIPKHTSIKINS